MIKPKRKAKINSDIAPRERVRVESLHRYLREESRAAGVGNTVKARKRFAKRCGTSVQYLVQLALGIRKAQPAIAIRIEQASYGLVRAEDLCEDFDWHYAKLRGVKAKPDPLLDLHVPERFGNIEITSDIPESAAA